MGPLLDLAYLVLAGVTAPWWMRKARSGWGERFGQIDPLPPLSPSTRQPTNTKRLLIHAVSVGEVNATRPLARELAKQNEAAHRDGGQLIDVVISVTTDTGMARAKALYKEASTEPTCHVVRYPLDASFAVKRFLRAVKPDAVALMELELWPNFARVCAHTSIPLCVINGRLSARSFKRYHALRAFIGRTFRKLTCALVQDADYAQRFRAMGVKDVRTLGTMKWDAVQVRDEHEPISEQAMTIAREMGIDLTRPLVVAGSTAPGEHVLLHKAVDEAAKNAGIKGVQLLCAPRKPEWFDEAAADMPECVRRSRGKTAPVGTTRYLLDTIGELDAAYELADVVVIGRSFGELYGSDPMGPAAIGKPMIIGPATADFAATMHALLEDKAIIQTTNDGLAAQLQRLLSDERASAALAANARACVRKHQGATHAYAAALRELL